MAIRISSTSTAVTDQGIKCLIAGASGAGKTRLTATLPGKTIILSAEAGLLSLREFSIDTIAISNIDELREAYTYLSGPEGNGYANIVLDSLSEIAEQILEYEKKQVKDGRLAYVALGEQVVGLVKAFRDLSGKNIILIAKEEKQKDEQTGAILHTPSFPGAKLAQTLPYLVDEVFFLHCQRNKETGEIARYLQTCQDYQYVAKDRSGALDQYEPADLAQIFAKIKQSTTTPAKAEKGSK